MAKTTDVSKSRTSRDKRIPLAAMLMAAERGDETILVVQTASGATLRCRQRSDATLTPGSQVSLIPTKVTPFVAFPR